MVTYVQKEIFIARAIEKMSKEANSSVKETARDFGISYDKLRAQFKGQPSKSDRISLNRKPFYMLKMPRK